MNAVLALDQGTTSSRALLIEREGAVLGVSQQEFSQFYPRPGWVEHDAREIWSSQLDCARHALQSAPPDAKVHALGIANQRETTVLWSRRSGQPVAPAIVWQDRRTAAACEALRLAGHESLIQSRTGLLLDAYFSATKLAWLLDNITGARAAAEAGELAFGTIDTWLAWNLTGEHVTDVSNASRTLLFNIHRLAWDEELLSLFNIPPGVLPRVVPSSGIVGTTRCEGLPRGLPVAGMAGDQQAALFGQACFEPGMAKNTYGTGCFMLMNAGQTPAASQDRLLSTVAWQLGDQVDYALEGSVFIGGAVVQWLRDGLEIIRDSQDIEALAASVQDSGGVYLVPAFAGLGAPHWDPDARGLLIGMTRGTRRAHVARAALESIAFQSADLLSSMTREAGIHLGSLRVDGGASRNDLLMQFQADLLQVPVHRPALTETTALGAAWLAGLATGVWRDRKELSERWQSGRSFVPRPLEEADRRRTAWHSAVERARGWASLVG